VSQSVASLLTLLTISTRVQDQLLNGDIPVTDEMIPLFLYNDDNYDPDAIEKDLLCGFLLLCISSYIVLDNVH